MGADRRLLARATLIAILLSGAVADAADQTVIASLSVDGVERPPVPIVLRGEDVLARVADLAAAGMKDFAGRRETLRGAEQVSLASLSPAVKFEFDARAIALRVTVNPLQMEGSRVDLAAPPPRPRLGRDASAFANYAVTLDQTAHLSAYGEVATSYGGALLFSGFSRRADGVFERGLTNLTLDEPVAMRRWVAGDVVATSGPLGSTLLLGGISVAREFSLDPYHVHVPLPQTQGIAQTPSELDIYVDGRLVRTAAIAPGPFEIANLPATAGVGSVRTVIRDAFGRATEVQSATYVSAGLLTPGLTDYQLATGYSRPDLNQPLGYREPVLMGRFRGGLLETLTAGASLEARRGLMSGGLNAAWLTPLGELDLAGALSTEHGVRGAAASVSHGYLNRRAGFGALLRWLSPTYATASMHSGDERTVVQASLNAGVSLNRTLSLGALAGADWSREGQRRDRASLRANLSLGANLALLVSAGVSRTQGLPSVAEGSVFLSWAFGERSTASATWDTQKAEGSPVTSTVAADLQRSLPIGAGMGYRVHAETGAQTSSNALLQFQGDHGRIEASAARFGTNHVGSVTASGGVVLMDKSLFATRPVEQGYALIQVPGVEGVPALLNNQEIGRTDSHGNLLVPQLSPYTANRLGIEPRALSMAYQVDTTGQTVATPFRAGVLVRFNVRRMRGVSGEVELFLASGERVPVKYGEMTVEDGGVESKSPLGSTGQFFIEQLSPGRHVAQVVHEHGVCSVVLDVPDGVEAIQNLGKLTCASGAAPSRTTLPAEQPRTLAGRLFLDENGDGRWSKGEPVIPEVELIAGAVHARTGADGRYLLSGVAAGATAQLASASELPAGFWIAERGPDGELAVRRPAAIEDLGSSLVLHLPEGPMLVLPQHGIAIALSAFLGRRPLTRAEVVAVQRLASGVSEVHDLRLLLIVRAPLKSTDAFARALKASRAAQKYLRDELHVPASRITSTIAAPEPRSPGGRVDVLYVHVTHRPPSRP